MCSQWEHDKAGAVCLWGSTEASPGSDYPDPCFYSSAGCVSAFLPEQVCRAEWGAPYLPPFKELTNTYLEERIGNPKLKLNW